MTQTVPTDLQSVITGAPFLGAVGDLADCIKRGYGMNTYDAVTASTTQTQAGGTKLFHGLNVIATASGSDAVTMPMTSVFGCILVIVNHTGQTIQLFPAVGGTINAANANAAVTIATATTSIYVSSVNNQWWGGAITNEG
jgi:hypothetical protein